MPFARRPWSSLRAADDVVQPGGAAWLTTRPYSVGNSLANYLQHNYPPDLQRAFPATFQLVASAQIAEEDQTTLDKLVSIFLHRITINENCRSATRIQDATNKQPALFLDLHYLITYWGTDARAEQTILAWTMLQLQSSPILDNSILSPSSTWDATENVLGRAASRLNIPMIGLLLDGGADPRALDADRRTAREHLPARERDPPAWDRAAALLEPRLAGTSPQ